MKAVCLLLLQFTHCACRCASGAMSKTKLKGGSLQISGGLLILLHVWWGQDIRDEGNSCQWTCSRAVVGAQATRNIAEFGKSFKRLRKFVHLSTAYVNCNQPHGSHVEERLYSFSRDDAVTHSSSSSRRAELAIVEELAAELATLPESAASQQVSTASNFWHDAVGGRWLHAA